MKILRLFLLPFSLIYGLIVFLRNKAYDYRIFKSYKIPGFSICVGNLSVGGTGKTPHVAFLTDYLSTKMETSIVSRGYGRSTKGFILLNEKSSANEVGDEPLFYFERYSDKVHVAVSEKRKIGVQKIQELFPDNQLIILDDAFQHRAVNAGLNILLTDFHSPYSRDFVLPAGNLREWKSGKNRADLVIVTKCPDDLNESIKKDYSLELKVPSDKLFFSQIIYADWVSFGQKINNPKSILLITGIANADPLLKKLGENFIVEHLSFGDHHVFSKEDIDRIHQKFDTFASDEKIILTTEKDYMRLKHFASKWQLDNYPWYYQPITIKIDNELKFKTIIDQYVRAI